jgi:hypothetical protein
MTEKYNWKQHFVQNAVRLFLLEMFNKFGINPETGLQHRIVT